MNWIITIFLVLMLLLLLIIAPFVLLFKLLGGRRRSTGAAREEELKMVHLMETLDDLERRLDSLDTLLGEPRRGYGHERG